MATLMQLMLGIFVLFPFLAVLLAWGVAIRVTGDRREAFLWGLYVGTLFFMLAVSALWQEVSGGTLGFWLSLLAAVALGAGLLVWLDRRRRAFSPGRALRAIWLTAFVVFVIEYVVLFCVGIVKTWLE
ncbi:MAG: DUF3397 family protein [Hydrogenibacillus sp.]|nr:DUF3397 family protein [Hydrogenibacillus sp.]